MRVKEICHSITDGSHNPPQGVEESKYLMLSSKNIFDDEITLDDPRFLAEDTFRQEDKRTRIIPGDVLLTIVGTVGRAAVVSDNMPRFTLQRSVAVLHPKEDVCLSRFLMYALRSKRTYIEKTAKGVAQKGIYLGEVGEIDLPLPSITQQETIVDVLDKINAVIQSRQRQLRTLDTLIKARFVEMFGDCRANPYGWKTKALSDVAEVGSSKRVFVEELQESGIPFYRGTEVGALAEGKAIQPELFITPEHYNELVEATGKPEPGDLLMPSICPDGRIWVVDTEKPFYFKDGRVLWVHSIDPAYDPIFLLYTLKDRIMTDYSSIASGTTFAELKIFALKQCQVFDVPIEKQIDFVNFIKQVDKSKVVECYSAKNIRNAV